MPEAVQGGRQLVIDLLPYGVSAIRIGAPGVKLADVTPYPSEAVMTSMEARYRELSNQLARLNRGPGAGQATPPNPGFEPDPAQVRQAQNAPEGEAAAESPDTVPPGWTLSAAGGSSITLDRTNPHRGRSSLKLATDAAPASVVSGNFVPRGASSLAIQAHFRAQPADARVRVWIEGQAAGQGYLRRSEIQVASGWEPRAVRAGDLPAGGLDVARLRFELLTPGTLWIDDLRVLGDGTPETVRVNAQRSLLAALQAYRVRRFAEFARLSRSHWARHPSLLAEGRGGRPGGIAGTPGPEGPGAGSAAASALSPDRRVR
jgi:hypothetical protein